MSTILMLYGAVAFGFFLAQRLDHATSNSEAAANALVWPLSAFRCMYL